MVCKSGGGGGGWTEFRGFTVADPLFWQIKERWWCVCFPKGRFPCFQILPGFGLKTMFSPFSVLCRNFFFVFKNSFSKMGKRTRFHCFEKSKIENDPKQSKRTAPKILTDEIENTLFLSAINQKLIKIKYSYQSLWTKSLHVPLMPPAVYCSADDGHRPQVWCLIR